jgi:hypothetical protein
MSLWLPCGLDGSAVPNTVTVIETRALPSTDSPPPPPMTMFPSIPVPPVIVTCGQCDVCTPLHPHATTPTTHHIVGEIADMQHHIRLVPDHKRPEFVVGEDTVIHLKPAVTNHTHQVRQGYISHP